MKFVQSVYFGWVRRQHYLAILFLVVTSIGILRAVSIPTLYNYDEGYHYTLAWKNPDLDRCIFQGQCAALLNVFYSNGLTDAPRGGIYYLLQGVILRGMPSWMDNDVRGVVARLVSVAMHGLSVWATYRAVRELFPRSYLAVLLATSLTILIPSLSDIGAGINLEIPAALIGALTFYTVALVLKYGLSWHRAVALCSELVIGYTLKGTIWPIFIIIPFAFWLKLSRPLRVFSLSLAVISVAVGGVLYAQPFWSGAAKWFFPLPRSTPGWSLPHRTDRDSVLGRYSFQTTVEGLPLSTSSYSYDVPDTIVQYLPTEILPRLQGKSITFGVWVRAAEGTVTVTAPRCESDDANSAPSVYVSKEWKFHMFIYQVPMQAKWLRCVLGMPQPFRSIVWYDGAILVEGEYPETQSIVYSDANGSSGVWSGKPFINLLQNPSAEDSWLQVNPGVGYPYPLNQRIDSFLSWQLTAPAWFAVIRWSLVSFWSAFGGEQPGLSPKQMIPLAILTLVAIAGVARLIILDFPHQQYIFHSNVSRQGFAMLLVAALSILGLIIYRADIVPFREIIFDFSSMRHASAGWLAICALLSLGILRWIPARHQRFAVSSLIIALFLINMHIFLRVQLPFYTCIYNAPAPGWPSCLWILPLD